MIVEVPAEALDKFSSGVKMTLRAALLQAVSCRQDAHPPTGYKVKTVRVAGQETTPKGIANSGWIHDRRRGDNWHFNQAAG